MMKIEELVNVAINYGAQYQEDAIYLMMMEHLANVAINLGVV